MDGLVCTGRRSSRGPATQKRGGGSPGILSIRSRRQLPPLRTRVTNEEKTDLSEYFARMRWASA